VKITVRLFGALTGRLRRPPEAPLEIPEGATVRDAVRALAGGRDPSGLGPFAIAVNGEIVRGDPSLSPGDELALLPPVSGGAPDGALTVDPLALGDAAAAVAGPDRGAVICFVGCVRRDETPDGVVEAIRYEAHERMAERAIAAIQEEAARRFGARLVIRHRLGLVPAGDASVVVAAAARHRAAAFEACRWAVEELKRTVPVWKQERTAGGGARWAEGTPLV
jgi:molybdopterin synthase catalytic subunit/molybdopterin converting factor small subunit